MIKIQKKYFLIPGAVITALLLFFILQKSSSSPQPAGSIEQNKTTISPMKKDSTRDYLKVHYDAILVDTHNDFMWQVFDKGADLKGSSFTQSDLPRFKSGGVDVQFFAVWIPMKEVKRSFNFVKKQINTLNKLIENNSSDIELAKSYNEIMSILAKNKMCGLIGIEGGTAIESDIDNVNKLYDMGVRYIGLTWNNSNNIASSARDETERGANGGLTEFGKQVVQRMNELGMMIDVAHLGEQSFWDVYKISTQPIFSSHSNAYSLNPHYRNLTDDQIKAIAKSGGVVQINFYDEFLVKNGKKNGTDLEKVIEHIDYIKNLVGVDYIGIGSDYDGGITPPPELRDASCYPLITKRLIEKGYTDEEIKKILGLNFLRYFKQVCK